MSWLLFAWIFIILVMIIGFFICYYIDKGDPTKCPKCGAKMMQDVERGGWEHIIVWDECINTKCHYIHNVR